MDIIQEYYPLFLNGAWYTIQLAFVTVVLSLPFGAALALMRISSNKILSTIARVYVEIIRGTPLLVQVYLVYFGLPMFNIYLDDFISAVLAVTINSTAYMGEIMRSGIQSIDTGQTEAARALGLPKWVAFRKVLLPQAIKNILPAIGNEFAVLIKETSIVSVLGIKDLMFASDTVRGATYTTFAPLLFAALLYFIMTFTISQLMNLLENRFAKADN
ncbi:amino acid ABC transporter permease [Ruoffia tabacinasalis]|jgi:His/Glu/Gln/Arg/opine family amino acid ABC transporter permease subunit|uniref:Amino acid ABC transporter permease n=1 Tax=Ruoffia tabacinasalis TaxID=87458 RepID=A0A5R9EH64_9LACT|nr:amino acid ABC transporter permease [Ruoffia tabacinasalis]MBG9978933.1 amino acid ABC transporter permease [Ruoffia tabacinasalis]TLQ49530.1 amino acid ABC transporter permease [Ruoffia tabacinasalis]HJG48967.1 amino acid ABC transporter permease [Ruoffia tabacinasalis]